MMKKILIVEDDELVSDLEKDYLEASGYQVDVCTDGEEGLKFAEEGNYDLLLLDVMLSGIDGFEICRRVRKIMDIPVILVTARKEDSDKIQGLGLGADDYITKPFSPSELVARVNAHIRIHERLSAGIPVMPQQNDVIAIGKLKIIPSFRQVLVAGDEVMLKNKEFELLLFLASNCNLVFSSETLYDRIWGMDANGNTATVAVHINRIREKIESCPSRPEYIQTVRGAGYRFVSRE